MPFLAWSCQSVKASIFCEREIKLIKDSNIEYLKL